MLFMNSDVLPDDFAKHSAIKSLFLDNYQWMTHYIITQDHSTFNRLYSVTDMCTQNKCSKFPKKGKSLSTRNSFLTIIRLRGSQHLL